MPVRCRNVTFNSYLHGACGDTAPDQEAHASFNVHCETDLNEQAFRSEVVPNAGMFTDMIKREIDRINKISGSGNMGGLHPAVLIA